MKTIFEVYREELHNAVKTYPDEYPWARDNFLTVDTVADRMIASMKKKSYNKDGRAFVATCKHLGIKYTYTAINEAIAKAQE